MSEKHSQMAYYYTPLYSLYSSFSINERMNEWTQNFESLRNEASLLFDLFFSSVNSK